MKQVTLVDYEARIQKVLLYIRNNLYEDLSLKTLSSIACFSEYHFHRVFRGMTGENIADHIRRLKMERAAWKLKLSNESVTDLAFEAGYDNVESFIRAFKTRYKAPPSLYRKKKNAVLPPKNAASALIKRKGAVIMIDAKIEKLDSRKVAFVRHTGPYAECGKAWKTLCSWAWPKGLLKKATLLGLSYDDPEITPSDKIRYDACVVVKGNIDPANGVALQEIPAGEYAVTVHTGPYEKLSRTYVQLCGEWLPKTGRKIKNQPSIEVYLNDPERTKPENLKVEIQVPLE